MEAFENGAEKNRYILSFPSAFSGVNEFAWTGENKTKMLVWSKIFCFVFVQTKTDAIKNASVWSEP